MIILRKQRIIFIISTVMVSILSVGLVYKMPLANTKETVALPVSNKIVILDAGHGAPDEGAESKNGVTENKINLAITLKLQTLLEQSGCTVLLTRSDENGIYDLDKTTLREKKVSDIKNRVKIGNESSADIFVSIHLNKIPQGQYWGWQTFYKKNNEDSKRLAKNIQDNLNKAIKKENKRQEMSISDKYIVEHIEIPITIVECGFLSNEEEENLLQNDEYQNQLAWGIYIGIIDYFNTGENTI